MDGHLKIWSLNDEMPLIRTITRKVPANNRKNEMSIYSVKSLQTNKVIVGCGNGYIEIWDYENSECLNKILAHKKYIWHIDISLNGEFVTSSGDKDIKSIHFNFYIVVFQCFNK